MRGAWLWLNSSEDSGELGEQSVAGSAPERHHPPISLQRNWLSLRKEAFEDRSLL